MKPFIKPRPEGAPPAAPGPAQAARISPNELTIFGVASSLTDPAFCAAYLDRACAGDAALRARIEERLAARAAQVPAAPATPGGPTQAKFSELVRPMHERALAAGDRPDALALVPMSAANFAAAQQPPRHSPIPWAAATILAIAVGALAVFLFTERGTRVVAEREAEAALMEREAAVKERDTAAAAALEAQTIAQRTDQARLAAEKEKELAAADAAKAREEAAQSRSAQTDAQAKLKAANDQAAAAQAEVARLRSETTAGQRTTALALADSLARLAALQLDARSYADAETNLRQALEIRTQAQADPWAILETRALLGSALLQRSQNAEAQEHFEAAANAIESLGPPTNDTDRARGAAASKRIVHFFTVIGQRKTATDLRRRLDTALAAQ